MKAALKFINSLTFINLISIFNLTWWFQSNILSALGIGLMPKTNSLQTTFSLLSFLPLFNFARKEKKEIPLQNNSNSVSFELPGPNEMNDGIEKAENIKKK